MRRFLILALFILVIAAGIVFGRYVFWVTNWYDAEDPFDEVGIGLHKMMPGFVQDWGCAQLKKEFGDKTMPPYGCRLDGERGWR